MIKILYVLNNALDRGGTEAVVLNYYYALKDSQELDIEFALHATVTESENSTLTQTLIDSGGIVHLITPRRISLIQERKDLKKLLQKEKYDIVHSHSDAIGADVLRIARECGVKIRIAHCHNTNFTINPDTPRDIIKWLYLNICRFMIRCEANYFMACSHRAAEWLFGNRIAEKTYILNNAIDVNKYEFSQSLRQKVREKLHLQDKYVIGHVGRLSYQKNHNFLLQIFPEILSKRPNAIMLFIGDGELKSQLTQECLDLKIEKSVIFYGGADNVADLLNAFDIFAFPSYYEGLSVALIEAQANGLHCIANDTDRVSKAADLTGLITWIPINNSQKWIETLSADCCQRKLNSKELITEHGFDLSSEASKLKEYYIQLYNASK